MHQRSDGNWEGKIIQGLCTIIRTLAFTLHGMGSSWRVLCRETGSSVLGFHRTTQETVLKIDHGGGTS